jgi:hypothetical protein
MFQASFSNGVFHIPAVQKSDESVYECIATNPAGSDTQRTVLYVTGKYLAQVIVSVGTYWYCFHSRGYITRSEMESS